MDLVVQNDNRAANVVFNRYLFRNPDFDDLQVLPLYQSIRATIRAHVLAKSASQVPDQSTREALISRARRYFDTANTLLEEAPIRIIAISGFSGTGKSILANRIAPLIGASPGAIVLSSDLVRKRLYSVEPDSRLGPHLYRSEVSDRVYRELLDSAVRVVDGQASVIIDATFMHADSRENISNLAASRGIEFHGYWLVGDTKNLRQRVAERPQGASDATPDVLEQQLEQDLGTVSWRQFNTTDPTVDAFDLVCRDLGLAGLSA